MKTIKLNKLMWSSSASINIDSKIWRMYSNFMMWFSLCIQEKSIISKFFVHSIIKKSCFSFQYSRFHQIIILKIFNQISHHISLQCVATYRLSQIVLIVLIVWYIFWICIAIYTNRYIFDRISSAFYLYTQLEFIQFSDIISFLFTFLHFVETFVYGIFSGIYLDYGRPFNS